eukprot:6707537-Pyramimonas_sp.AAC.1
MAELKSRSNMGCYSSNRVLTWAVRAHFASSHGPFERPPRASGRGGGCLRRGAFGPEAPGKFDE